MLSNQNSIEGFALSTPLTTLKGKATDIKLQDDQLQTLKIGTMPWLEISNPILEYSTEESYSTQFKKPTNKTKYLDP